MIVALCCCGPATAATTVLLNDSPARACYETVLRHGNDLEPCDLALELQTLAPKDRAATYSNRGILLVRLGKPEQALLDHNRAVSLAPESASVLINRSKALTQLKRYTEAFQDLERAIVIQDTAVSVAYYNRALLFLRLGDLVAARSDAEQAVAHAPESAAYQAFLEQVRAMKEAGATADG